MHEHWYASIATFWQVSFAPGHDDWGTQYPLSHVTIPTQQNGVDCGPLSLDTFEYAMKLGAPPTSMTSVEYRQNITPRQIRAVPQCYRSAALIETCGEEEEA